MYPLYLWNRNRDMQQGITPPLLEPHPVLGPIVLQGSVLFREGTKVVSLFYF